MKAMILAAGFGERMRPLTNHLPKPLLPVGNSTLIELHLRKLKVAGISEVVINVSWLAEKIEEHLGDGSRYGLKLVYSREETPMETAGGIKQALPFLGEEAFLLINADIWTDFDLGVLLNTDVLKKQRLAHLVLVKNPEHNPEGDFQISKEGLLTEKQNLAGQATFTFSGISVLHPVLFSGELVSRRLVDVLKQACNKGLVGAQYYDGQWMDIGTPERLQYLQALLR